MQVSQVSDHITHAIVGGQKAKSFRIAQTAEFYHLLSDALYSDKPMAAVREVLCNGWDAHIATGITNTPIQITVTDDEMIIRDFGSGIHPDLIEDIYCVYGGSTKTHDGKQTGGFGLGSKAPFAVTDHFEVTSFYQGTKTIYRMAKGNSTTGGSPGAVPIVSLPTDETGLQVRIPIETHKRSTYLNNIKKIVRFGEMLATLNGEPMATIPFSTFPDGFYASDSLNFGQSLNIRYGNVVYPVEKHQDYLNEYHQFAAYFGQNRAAGYFGNWTVILQADPDTIAVTPSRESLSMTERTITTIRELLTRLNAKVETYFVENENRLIQESIDLCWLNHSNFNALFDPRSIFPNYRNLISSRATRTTVADLARDLVVRRIQASPLKQRQVKLRILKSIVASGYDRTGHAQSLLRHLTSKKQKGSWFHRKVVAPLWLAMDATKHMKIDNLKLISGSEYAGYKFTNFPLVRAISAYDSTALTKGVVILAYTREAIRNRAHKSPLIKHRYTTLTNLFAYIVPKKAEQVTEAKAFFESRGYQILDLTVWNKWEGPEPVKVTKAPVVVTRSNFRKLSATFTDYYNQIDCSLLNKPADPADLIDKPEYFIWAAKQGGTHFPNWSPLSTAALRRLYGDRGTIVITKDQERRAIKAGAIPVHDWLEQKLKADCSKNKTLRVSLSHRMAREQFELEGSDNHLFNFVHGDEVLARKFGIWLDKSQDHKDRIQLIKRMAELKKVATTEYWESLVGSVKSSKSMTNFLNKIQGNPLNRFVEWYYIGNSFKRAENKPQELERIRKFVLNLIKG